MYSADHGEIIRKNTPQFPVLFTIETVDYFGYVSIVDYRSLHLVNILTL